jgi:hypothetical protein
LQTLVPDGSRSLGPGTSGQMRSSSARAAVGALAVSACLGLTAAACTREDSPAAPATSVAPASAPGPSDANTVPPGVSGQGSQGGEGEGTGANP